MTVIGNNLTRTLNKLVFLYLTVRHCCASYEWVIISMYTVDEFQEENT